jgi:hypothetical protein
VRQPQRFAVDDGGRIGDGADLGEVEELLLKIYYYYLLKYLKGKILLILLFLVMNNI